jgi:hypothetical protein
LNDDWDTVKKSIRESFTPQGVTAQSIALMCINYLSRNYGSTYWQLFGVSSHMDWEDATQDSVIQQKTDAAVAALAKKKEYEAAMKNRTTVPMDLDNHSLPKNVQAAILRFERKKQKEQEMDVQRELRNRVTEPMDIAANEVEYLMHVVTDKERSSRERAEAHRQLEEMDIEEERDAEIESRLDGVGEPGRNRMAKRTQREVLYEDQVRKRERAHVEGVYGEPLDVDMRMDVERRGEKRTIGYVTIEDLIAGAKQMDTSVDNPTLFPRDRQGRLLKVVRGKGVEPPMTTAQRITGKHYKPGPGLAVKLERSVSASAEQPEAKKPKTSGSGFRQGGKLAAGSQAAAIAQGEINAGNNNPRLNRIIRKYRNRM